MPQRPSVKPADAPLDDRELVFVEEYLTDLDAQRAARDAGYSANTARCHAHSWVANTRFKPHVYAAVQKGMAERLTRVQLHADDVVRGLMKIGFASLRRCIRLDAEGLPVIDLTDTPDADLYALEEVSTETVLESTGRDSPPDRIRKTRIRMQSRITALKLLADHIGVFEKRDKSRMDSLSQSLDLLLSRGSKAPVVPDARIVRDAA